jgi:diacylglycerol kinase
VLNSSSIADPVWLLGLKSVSGIFFISGASWALDGVHKAYGDKEAFRFMTRTLLLVAVFAAGFFLGRGSV